MDMDLVMLADKIQKASDVLQRESLEGRQIVEAQETVALASCHRLLAITRVVLDEKKSSLPNHGWRGIVVSLAAKVISTVRAAHALAAAGHARGTPAV